MTRKLQVYQSSDITVTYDPNICVHAGVCVRGLHAVFGESRLQVLVLCGLCHLRKGGEDLLLGEVDVLQRVVKKLVERLWGLGHGMPPVAG